MSNIRPIGIQLYTVREALKAADWEGTFEKIAEMGYLGVETCRLWLRIRTICQGAVREQNLMRLGLEANWRPFGPAPSAIRKHEVTGHYRRVRQ